MVIRQLTEVRSWLALFGAGIARGAALGTLVALVVTAGLGCGPSAPSCNRVLIGELVPLPVSPDAAVPPTAGRETASGLADSKPRRVSLGDSSREAVLTDRGTAQSASISLPATPVLEFSLALNGRRRRPCDAWVELVAGHDRHEVFRTTVQPGSSWVSFRVPLPDLGIQEADLVLRSDDSTPLAWGEVLLTGRTRDRRPNLVLIVVDTLRSDHLSCYGYSRKTSPNLDRLAAEGTLFTNSSSPSSWTLPSMSSLLSGLLPDQHRVHSMNDTLNESVTTVAERLQEAGYRTAAFVDGGFVSPRWGFAQGFLRYDSTGGQAWHPKDIAKIEEMASEWLANNRFEPFFLLVHSYETHQPYTYREGFTDRFLADGVDNPVPRIVAWELEGQTEDTQLLEHAVAYYDGEIARADHYLGRLLQNLSEHPASERTAIVVTSDHGEEFLEHGGVEHGHGKVFNEHVRVPMILKGPGIGRGVESNEPVTGLDIAVTLLDLAGVAPSSDLVGESLIEKTEPEKDGRAILVHGFNSLTELDEERLRLDKEDVVMIFDRKRHELQSFDTRRDPGLDQPAPIRRDPLSLDLLQRLQLLLAAESDTDRYLLPLPLGARAVVTQPGSRVTPRLLWSSHHSRPLDNLSRGQIRSLPEDVPCTLVLDVADGDGDLEIELMQAGSTQLTRHLLALPPNDAPPLWRMALSSGALPPMSMLRTVAPLAGQTTVLGERERTELRALGYLE